VAGYALLELFYVVALLAIVAAIAVPLGVTAIDSARTSAAARYLAGRLRLARMEALRRSANVGLRIEPGQDDRCTFYADGNGNGVRTVEIQSGVDYQVWNSERLGEQFPGVRFGLFDGVTEVESTEALGSTSDPIRIGSSNILSFSPIGSATSGTLYLRGRNRQQYAVRVLGVTGRVRVLRFDFPSARWVAP
jgi:type II secretory pathway pseudopilin PulG